MEEKQKVHVSFSEYRLFNACNHKHYLSKKLRIQEPGNEFLSFGSALHSAIEEVVTKKRIKIMWEKIFQTKLKDETNEIFSTSFFGKKMVQQGSDILKALNFFERYKDWEVVGVEYDLYEPLMSTEDKDYFFKGFVDMVIKKDDQYLILDWKSAQKPWDIEKKYKLQENSEGQYEFPTDLGINSEEKSFFGQLALYKLFMSQKLNVPLENISTAFVCLARDPVDIQQYNVEPSKEYLDFILQDIKNTVIAIETIDPKALSKAKFNNNLSACQYCFYKKNEAHCNEDEYQLVLKPEEVVK